MKSARKKSATKSGKSKSIGASRSEIKATPEKPKKTVRKNKTVNTKSGALSLTKLKSENKTLVRKLVQKNRELEIEAALERVRASAMAMHSSEGLAQVTIVLREQIALLGERELESILIHLYDEKADEFEAWYAYRHPGSQKREIVNGKQVLNWRKTARARIDKEKFYGQHNDYTIVADYEMLKEWYEYLCEVVPEVVEVNSKGEILVPDVLYYNYSRISSGALLLITNREASEASKNLLKRAAKVFNLAYSRFLDLKKAEQNAREAQIEASLERVRSHSMAMHKSDELLDVIRVVSDQLHFLNIKFEFVSFGANSPEYDFDFWLASSVFDYPQRIHVPYLDNPIPNSVRDARTMGMSFFTNVFTKEDNRIWLQALLEHNQEIQFSEKVKEYLLNTPGFARSSVLLKNIDIYIGNYIPRPYSDEENEIIVRFAKVFEQSYTRFLDLQKAEAQAREAQIEAALERVRSRTMGMQHSDELPEAAGLLFQQLQSLGMPTWAAGYCIWDEDKQGITFWMCSEGILQAPIWAPSTVDPSFGRIREAFERGEMFFVEELSGEGLVRHYQYMRTLPVAAKTLDEIIDAGHPLPDFQIFHAAFISQGFLLFTTYEPVIQAHEIFKRFARVFEQTYTRFLDLQKAEAQAEEAQIEVSLERVRAKTMAMHNSQDVGAATAVMFNELVRLDVGNMRCGVGIMKADSTMMEVWTATVAKDGHDMKGGGLVDGSRHPLWQQMRDDWRAKKEIFFYHLKGDDLKAYYRALASFSDYSASYINDDPPEHYCYVTFFDDGGVFTFTTFEYSDEQKQILKRFASVFNLTYRRYLDLQKAESQAREAQIEASLERVRGKAMAMHSSEDLSATIGIFYRELESFSITPRRGGVGLLEKETRMAELSTMNTTAQGNSIEVIGRLNMQGHPVLEGVFDNWILQREYHPVLRGNEIKEYYQLIRPQIAFPEYPNDAVQYGYFFFFQEGGVYAWTEKEMTDAELKLYRRFTSVLSLTYKRYKDLKDAETRTLLAIRESSLDRVRAEIASMRNADDLQHITPLVWRELLALGVPFFRCGVMIVDNQAETVQFYLSTPDGKPLAALNLGFEVNSVTRNGVDNWRQQKVYTEHWDKEQFIAFTKGLMEQGQIQTATTYQGGEAPPESLTLQFVPFPQGMLYVGSVEPLTSSQIELVKVLADAFSVAYSRYEDFTKLEAAKQQIEKTLVDLKQTQTQLVQSEKMASLGELTAGIAHEIQNPLNFVNNFSEVNKELLVELAEEIEKGNFDEAKTIAKDIIGNEEKINHHGKRADAIVKGMLQHSRASSGIKEPTDINALADEYLRLSYHGLRAKDKSFNASFKTDYEEKMGNVNVVPQEIGRVILNLINNAFYAVSEKRKTQPDNYEPAISVCTNKTNSHISISVKDNGNGIPQKVLDKIFQPFFTTKPTGQGTGLGLSLSYDIVKAHGGEITVNSNEGKGSEFVILLPISISTI